MAGEDGTWEVVKSSMGGGGLDQTRGGERSHGKHLGVWTGRWSWPGRLVNWGDSDFVPDPFQPKDHRMWVTHEGHSSRILNPGSLRSLR